MNLNRRELLQSLLALAAGTLLPSTTVVDALSLSPIRPGTLRWLSAPGGEWLIVGDLKCVNTIHVAN